MLSVKSFSIHRKEKIKMNFEGSPQCGNAGDMKFEIGIEGTGNTLDSQAFVFDSMSLFELFMELKKGKWHGSCEGIGVYCANWLFNKEPTVLFITVKVTTESTNTLTITLDRKGAKEVIHSGIHRHE